MDTHNLDDGYEFMVKMWSDRVYFLLVVSELHSPEMSTRRNGAQVMQNTLWSLHYTATTWPVGLTGVSLMTMSTALKPS